MKRLEFYKLERPVQERFVNASRGLGVPPLLVGKQAVPLGAWRWVLLAVLLAAAWLYLAGLGYGKLESSLAVQPRWMGILHVALPVLAGIAALMARRSVARRARLPFVQTTYLFPIGVVNARSAHLVQHGWEDLKQHSIVPGRASFEFVGGSFTFPVGPSMNLAELEQRVTELKERVGTGTLEERDLVLLNPLRDNGFRNPFSPSESMRPLAPKKLVLWPVLVLVALGLLGVASFAVRNTLGERAIYAVARQKDSVEGYRAYLSRGGKRSDVTELLLPRAELREAIAAHSVEAIERYMEGHPGSKIQTEVQAALRTALLAALEETKKKNTITAFRAFEKRHARHLPLVPELPQARFAYLSGVLDRFQKEHKPTREEWLLARRLIVYADQHGPEAQIRFAQRESRTLEKNEHLITASAYYGGQKTLPTRYLVGAPVRKAEKAAADELTAGFAEVFPADLLHFELGPPVEGTSTPSFEVPTLFVSYRLEISGAFVTKKPRAIFAGVGLVAEATLSVPDKEPPDTFKHTAWLAPERRRIEAGEVPPEEVYQEVMARAFARFTSKYLAPWLGED